MFPITHGGMVTERQVIAGLRRSLREMERERDVWRERYQAALIQRDLARAERDNFRIQANYGNYA